MEFSLDQFYRLNRRVLIWAALFFLIWLLRDFFGMIFLVFVLTFISATASRLGQKFLRLPARGATGLVYAGFLVAFFSFFRLAVPHVIQEAQTLVGNLGEIETTLIAQKEELVRHYPSLDPLLMGYVRNSVQQSEDAMSGPDVQGGRDEERLIRLFINQQLERVRDYAPQLIKHLWSASVTMLLALFFSFLISLDADRLRQELKSLQNSRLRDFYEQTARPVVRFGYIVGQALQAQAVIACANTGITLLGLLLLGVPNIAVLSFLVFLCSFVPVLGVFLSTTPIVLVALNSGGLGQAVGVIVLVAASHLLEAYVLNPWIYGRHLKLNPVVVLIILFVGHHAFGLWGMLLGVPVAHYFLHDVIGVPLWERGRLPDERDENTTPTSPAAPECESP